MNNKNKEDKKIKLQKVLFYGRTLEEYLKMFDLDLSLLKDDKILDCPSGPASFVAEASQLGINVVGCDILYSDQIEALIDTASQDISIKIQVSENYAEKLSKNFYSSIELMEEYATSALKKFAEDYPIGRKENRYIQAELPNLPFSDNSFDLVLSGYLLFCYPKQSNEDTQNYQFDYQFHINAVKELLRVSKKEVRIFPIGNLYGKHYEYVDRLLDDLHKEGIVSDIRTVEYEASRGVNQLLCLSH